MSRNEQGFTAADAVVLIVVLGPFVMLAVAPLVQNGCHRVNTNVACRGNMRRVYQGLQIHANENNGKLPQCFDVKASAGASADGVPDENSWWFRKVADLMYTDENPLDVEAERFRSEACILRCPASPDDPDGGDTDTTDKDRVYDENYGFNNWGFHYTNRVADRLPDPRKLEGGDSGASPLYHGSGAITGYYETGKDRSYIGLLADVPYASSTILLMDYVKADIAPMGGSRGPYDDDVFGYRFRHESEGLRRANVLFVDGHVESFTEKAFARKLGKVGTLHWDVVPKRRALDGSAVP